MSYFLREGRPRFLCGLDACRGEGGELAGGREGEEAGEDEAPGREGMQERQGGTFGGREGGRGCLVVDRREREGGRGRV